MKGEISRQFCGDSRLFVDGLLETAATGTGAGDAAYKNTSMIYTPGADAGGVGGEEGGWKVWETLFTPSANSLRQGRRKRPLMLRTSFIAIYVQKPWCFGHGRPVGSGPAEQSDSAEQLSEPTSSYFPCLCDWVLEQRKDLQRK